MAPEQQQQQQQQQQQRFTLTRGTPDDLDEVLRLQYACFPVFIREQFMGCKTEADLPRLAARQREEMRSADAREVWVLVRDTHQGGRLAAASNWRFYLNAASVAAASDEQPPPWLAVEDPDAFAKGKKLMDMMNAARKAAHPEGFVHLHICFTSPDYRRKGAGSLMMQWGCDLADQLGLPGWIEASTEGNFLYKTFGFYDVGTMSEGDMTESSFMQRDAKTQLGPKKS